MIRRAAIEGIGTASLLVAIVGSGIMAERLCDGNIALALLANSLATGAALVALILAFASVSGAHFNPVVTLVEGFSGHIAWREVPGYIAFQFVGAVAGVGTAHLMFGLPLFFWSRHARGGLALAFSEFVATFGLILVIWGCGRSRPAFMPLAVGCYITAAYWFTASTSFANPAVTLARAATDTFTGIRSGDTPAFVFAQLAGAISAWLLSRWIETAQIDHPGEEKEYGEEASLNPLHR